MAADTRVKLILAAERLFGTHGIHAVSVREIVEAAGQRNISALNYHFGTREGLVAEVINFRRSWVDTERVRLLDCFQADGLALDALRIAQAVASPLVRLMLEEECGANYVLFLSQVFVSKRIQFAPAVRGRFDAGLRRCLRAYRALRPELATQAARERFTLCGRGVVYALADWHRDTNGRSGGQRASLTEFQAGLVPVSASVLAAGAAPAGLTNNDLRSIPPWT